MGFKQWLNESVSVRVQDYHEDNLPKDLDELANAVRIKISGLPGFNQASNSEILAPDGLDVGSVAGKLNFYTQGIPEDNISKIMSAIKFYLKELGAEFGLPQQAVSNMFQGQPVIRIPVSIQPSKQNRPPEVNMANGVAEVIFNKVLNMTGVNLNMYSISARDLLIKLENVPQFTIRQSIVKPNTSQEPGKAKFIDFGIDEQRIQRHLEALIQLCRWAIENGYDTLSLS